MFCVPEADLHEWCAAASAPTDGNDAAILQQPAWTPYDAPPWTAADPWVVTWLYLLSLMPLVVLISHRLFAHASSDLLPLPLALAVACVTPALMLDAAVGLLASVALNALLLVHLQRLKAGDLAPPSSPAAAAHGRPVGPPMPVPEAVLQPVAAHGAASPPPSVPVRPVSLGPMQADAVEARSPPRGTAGTAGAATASAATTNARPPLDAPPQDAPPAAPVAPEAAEAGAMEIRLPDWSPREARALECGELVLKKGVVDGRQQGMASQRVHAPAATVWERILDFAMWPKMVDNVVATRVYGHSLEADGEHLKVEVTVGLAMMRIRTYVHHVYDKERSLMTWTLDEEQESDLEGNCGFWLVQQDPDDPGWSVVNYSISVTLKSWAPSWLDSLIAVQGLPKAVAWVKREAEKRLKRRIQSAPDLTRLG